MYATKQYATQHDEHDCSGVATAVHTLLGRLVQIIARLADETAGASVPWLAEDAHSCKIAEPTAHARQLVEVASNCKTQS